MAYRCSLRVTEAVYLIERMIDVLAQKIGVDKAEIRRRNFVQAEQFPYTTSLGWTLDSGNYHAALDKVLKAVDYDDLRREQEAKRADPNCPTLMGIGISTFTEIVGAGPTKVCDILGIGLFDSCEIRVHPTGGVIARLGTMTQGQGHATTYAQIIATELGLPASDIVVEEGDTDKAPYGAGTWGSRSTPVSGAATAQAARKIKDKAKQIAAHLLEVGEGDLEWEIDRFQVKGNTSQAKTMKELCMASHTGNLPAGMEQGLNAVSYYDPPNLTFPFGAYLCVVDIDKFTGDTKVRRFYALDDCGTRINPMIIEGQIHGGLTEAFAVAMGQQMPFDEQRQPPGQQPDGLLPAHRDGNAALGDRPHRHAMPAPPDRRQGRGRVAARRRHSLLQQRGDRCVRTLGCHAHGHAAHRLPRLAATEGAGAEQALIHAR